MQQDQWHYNDERKGQRLGPIDLAEMRKLIETDKVDRATLVWNPTMPEWAKASATDLAPLFGNGPPPLPANRISRWAIYALALFPAWGLFVQALLSAGLASRFELTPASMFDHRAWIPFYILVNGILGDLDALNLKRGGLKIRGAAVLAALLVPVYIFASCRTIKRHAGRGAWLAYLPFILWLIALASTVVLDPLFFNSDAPIIFRPDEWL